MTPERIEELSNAAAGARDRKVTVTLLSDELEALCTIAKSAIPSGQVAEDRRMLMFAIQPWTEGEHKARLAEAIHRLSAQAQSADNYRGMWQDAERGRMALLAERDALKAKVDDLEEAINGAGGWRYALAVESRLLAEERERCTRLSTAGQVLSEHVDKEQCPCLTNSPMGIEHPCPEHDAPGWTMRDEFAKAAMHTVVIACKGEIAEGILRFADVARRAYRMADAMVQERGDKP